MKHVPYISDGSVFFQRLRKLIAVGRDGYYEVRGERVRLGTLGKSLLLAILAILAILAFQGALASAASIRPPNVILIITDDQGYGDVGLHGNTMIQTPQLDTFARESIRFTNFHVDPTCAETRSALMTGKYSCRVGVWHTIMGRSILRADEKTMPQYFADSGYQTGQFGKWHLGDNWPYRPQDRGFQESLCLRGGGVGQSPDHWANDYFDDTYQRNGVPEKQTGYCTDVFFKAATDFIGRNRQRPFFCYIATNAPHSPYHVDPRYSDPYVKQGVPQPMANFYGMIANIDENVGRLLAKLDEWKLADDTIVVFMTDNGSAAGTPRVGPAGDRKSKTAKKNAAENNESKRSWDGFAAGMRAAKGSQYEGGHRVPCFVRLPKTIRPAPNDISALTSHIDLLPSFVEWCGLKGTGSGSTQLLADLDGESLAPIVRGDRMADPNRTIVVHSQRIDFPEKLRKCAVMRGTWRLVDGKELYDLSADPGQTRDIASDHPDQVGKLLRAYDGWWNHVSPRFAEYSDIPLGDDPENRVDLCCHDWHPVGGDAVPWNQSSQDGVSANPDVNGKWAVEVRRDGKYSFKLRMRPIGVDYPLPEGLGRVQIGEAKGEAKVTPGASEVTVTLELKKSNHVMLQTWLDSPGHSRGAYYVTIQRVVE